MQRERGHKKLQCNLLGYILGPAALNMGKILIEKNRATYFPYCFEISPDQNCRKYFSVEKAT